MTTSGVAAQIRCQRAVWFAAAALMMAALAACGHRVDVNTVAAPEAVTLSRYRTFTIVESGNERASFFNNTGTDNAQNATDGYGINDPMIHNSITSQAVHDEIKAAFEERGYRYSPDKADFVVAYEATIAPIMDIRSYGGDYGYYGMGYFRSSGYYGYGYDGFGCCGGWNDAVATYDRSTVIIDAVGPDGKLLWRGQGTADGYTASRRYRKDLRHAVKAIAKKFPPASPTGELITE